MHAYGIEGDANDCVVLEHLGDAHQDVREHTCPRVARRDAVFCMKFRKHRFCVLFAEWMVTVRDVSAASNLDDSAENCVVTCVDDDISSRFYDASRQDASRRPSEDAFLQAMVRMAD